MSALGQKQTCAVRNRMSALHPIATAKADIAWLMFQRGQRSGVVLAHSSFQHSSQQPGSRIHHLRRHNTQHRCTYTSNFCWHYSDSLGSSSLEKSLSDAKSHRRLPACDQFSFKITPHRDTRAGRGAAALAAGIGGHGVIFPRANMKRNRGCVRNGGRCGRLFTLI